LETLQGAGECHRVEKVILKDLWLADDTLMILINERIEVNGRK